MNSARAAIGESDAVRALAERVDALAEASDAAARAQAHRQEALWHHIERLERDADDDDGLGEQTNLTRLLQRRRFALLAACANNNTLTSVSLIVCGTVSTAE